MRAGAWRLQSWVPVCPSQPTPGRLRTPRTESALGNHGFPVWEGDCWEGGEGSPVASCFCLPLAVAPVGLHPALPSS